MILKDKNTIINLTITKGKGKEGLKEKDYWCLCKIEIERNNKKEEYKKEAISFSELNQTIKEIESFLTSKKCYQKRYGYIKNYVVLFFHLKKRTKLLKIRLVHPNNKNNIEILLENKEIENFLEIVKEQKSALQ